MGDAVTDARALASVLLAALATLAPSLPANAAPERPLGYDNARHLLARAGFGPTDREVRAFAPLTPTEAVDRLLREARRTASTAPPAALVATTPLRPARLDQASDEERKAFRAQRAREAIALSGWWTQEMLATPSPLTERMTLFWHNHFVSAQPKVRIARLMYRQNVTLRAHALGNFGTLLHAIARDPAMLVYLDGVQNRKGSPNENFAREVMELFTLGEGHYGEADVKEAARALTGYGIDRESGEFRFRAFQHDHGVKTIFGKSGRFDGDAFLDLLLARPETAEFVVAKLWREFVAPGPGASEVAGIARRFRESNYDIKVALAGILTSDAFYASANRGTLVKSPIELVVGTLRQLELEPADATAFAFASAAMGQNLLAPPNVRGWPGGDTWINASTLLARKAFLDRLTRAGEAPLPALVMADVAIASEAAGAPIGNERPAGDGERGAAMVAPKARDAATAAKANDAESARARRVRREIERALDALHFDSARFFAGFAGSDSRSRAQAVQRLLLATAPLAPPDYDADSLTFVRALMQDAAYQLK
jgi:uncharacterized protein (DUF1800 family)